jgi:phenylpyruvate tautomerase PptA (4-oxalocrotonate tautomerase family)
MPLVKVYLDKGSRSAEERADLARKITDLFRERDGYASAVYLGYDT